MAEENKFDFNLIVDTIVQLSPAYKPKNWGWEPGQDVKRKLIKSLGKLLTPLNIPINERNLYWNLLKIISFLYSICLIKILKLFKKTVLFFILDIWVYKPKRLSETSCVWEKSQSNQDFQKISVQINWNFFEFCRLFDYLTYPIQNL